MYIELSICYKFDATIESVLMIKSFLNFLKVRERENVENCQFFPDKATEISNKNKLHMKHQLSSSVGKCAAI